ncbi:MAG: ATP synthase subunit I [Limnochordales bacterium]|jgi:hypothetical protein|nr:ATP synthase subunit I [Bacillota bacterium]
MTGDTWWAARIGVAAAAGFALGWVYFWGLWWTSRRIARVRRPWLLLGVSYVVRMAVLLLGVWLATRGRLPETAVCVAGILLARQVVVGAVRRGWPEETPS